MPHPFVCCLLILLAVSKSIHSFIGFFLRHVFSLEAQSFVEIFPFLVHTSNRAPFRTFFNAGGTTAYWKKLQEVACESPLFRLQTTNQFPTLRFAEVFYHRTRLPHGTYISGAKHFALHLAVLNGQSLPFQGFLRMIPGSNTKTNLNGDVELVDLSKAYYFDPTISVLLYGLSGTGKSALRAFLLSQMAIPAPGPLSESSVSSSCLSNSTSSGGADGSSDDVGTSSSASGGASREKTKKKKKKKKKKKDEDEDEEEADKQQEEISQGECLD